MDHVIKTLPTPDPADQMAIFNTKANFIRLLSLSFQLQTSSFSAYRGLLLHTWQPSSGITLTRNAVCGYIAANSIWDIHIQTGPANYSWYRDDDGPRVYPCSIRDLILPPYSQILLEWKNRQTGDMVSNLQIWYSPIPQQLTLNPIEGGLSNEKIRY